jgi:uncharacterized YigZ family protein
MEEFPALMKRLKNEHPKAGHIAYAYRHINKYEQIAENSSDDGEPRGCAGAPILNAMRGEDMIECGLAVVRYFGGIKLGTGGMVRAYGAAARAVLEAAPLLIWERRETFVFRCGYARIRQVEYWLDRCGISGVERNFRENDVLWTLRASAGKLASFRELAGELPLAGELKPN